MDATQGVSRGIKPDPASPTAEAKPESAQIELTVKDQVIVLLRVTSCFAVEAFNHG